MRTSTCPACHLGPRQFGRGKNHAFAADEGRTSLASDVRLFVTTFAAGFLFVSLYVG